MAESYDHMMGDPMDVSDHPANNMSEARSRLGQALKDRSDYLNDPEVGIQERDRRETTMNAVSRGDYKNGTYNPFRPNRSDY